MTRPRICRHLQFKPKAIYFKPQGIPLGELEEVVLERAELEAIKLKDYDGLEQILAAEKMKVSQSTFQRILFLARKKIARGIVEGKALKMED